ncbi:MAG: hypothetical protein RL291_1365 [Pseudomonadota bacterium]
MRRERGFSLMETLVALGIAAAAMTAYYSSISSSMRLEQVSRARAEAALVAGQVLDRIGHEIPLDAATREERTPQGFVWRLDIQDGAALEPLNGAPVPTATRVKTIDIVVSGPGLSAPYRVSTLRVGRDVLR